MIYQIIILPSQEDTEIQTKQSRKIQVIVAHDD